VASVRGSYMNVWVDPETLDVYVTCLEGDCHAENEAGDVDFTDGEKTVLFSRNEDGTYTPPGVDEMTEEEFQKWLDENPEARELFEQAMATLTAMAPTATNVPPTDEPTATPEGGAVVPGGSGSGGACVEIISPPNGSDLPHQGPVEFEWQSRPGASRYILTFHYPGGGSDSFETDGTSMTRYIESIAAGGEFSWDVTVFGSDGGAACTTEPVNFTKPESNPEPEKEKEEEEEPIVCTAENAQWVDPQQPCYCDEGAQELPPYCYAD
jgi:hypothetical protein